MKVSSDFIVFLFFLFFSIGVNFQRSLPLFFILTLLCTGIFFVIYKIIRRFHQKKQKSSAIAVFYGLLMLIVVVIGYLIFALFGNFCGIDIYIPPVTKTNIFTGKCSTVKYQCDGIPWYYRDDCQVEQNSKPKDLYLTEQECKANSKQGYCLQSRCAIGESNGSRNYDGSVVICSDSWDGWIPVNEVIPN